MSATAKSFELEVEINYPTAEQAEIVCGSLSVDKELRRDVVQRILSSSGSTLLVKFICADPRILRTSVSSFFDLLSVANDAIEHFSI